MSSWFSLIAAELSVRAQQVQSVISLSEEGATVPFLARYRKEATGGLDEVQIRSILEKHNYIQELEDRKATVLRSIEDQGKLTDELKKRIETASEKQEVEDLYAPYKPKRRSRAQQAREKGLGPLAERMWLQKDAGQDIHTIATAFVSEQVASSIAALAGARDIAAEEISDRAELRALVRERTLRDGVARGEVIKGKEETGAKFRDYFDFSQPIKDLPSHRILALRRAETEEAISFHIEAPAADLVQSIQQHCITNPDSPWATQLQQAAVDAYQRLLAPAIEAEVRLSLKQRADEEAIEVFAKNLRHLLLASPLGSKRVLALDPGFRTGCKLAVLSETGRFLETSVIYPHPPSAREKEAADIILRLVEKHKLEAVAIGNGTAGRESERFVRQVLQKKPEVIVVSVEESGASIYSASDIARDEFPELDLTIRGAISIGRRLQDPLAELVKIDPKSIGVGQYQHDVDQPLLKTKLDDVVESCVNTVGVDVNLASAPLLSYVSGIGPSLAKNIVQYRDQNGPFKTRAELRSVPRFGPKTFEQAAGFLKIRSDKAHPLDASAVHPERYELVERIAKDLGLPLQNLIHNQHVVDGIPWSRYVSNDVGIPTLKDIATELKRPGRDPRADFQAAQFDESITEIEHLKEGMILEGTITNVTNFGAFVDVGVHQDGLVHVSQLSTKFVKDPTEVVSVGQRVKVCVMSVDIPRKRIGLSIRAAEEQKTAQSKTQSTQAQTPQAPPQRSATQANTVPNHKHAQKHGRQPAQNNNSLGTFADMLRNRK